jgi:hypothetical protein
VNGAGTVALTGTTEISGGALEGSAIMKNSGSLTVSGTWYDGYNSSDTAQFSNLAGATFTIANNSYIYSVTSAAFSNAGSLVKLGGGESRIDASTTNTGSITIASGVLDFDGASNSFGGTVGGAGTLLLAAGADTFASGLALTANDVTLAGANLTLGANTSYAGTWTESSGTLALAGLTFTVSGSGNLDGGVVNGAGTLALTGSGAISSFALEGSAVLKNSGSVTQTGYWYLGYNSTDTSQLNNAAGATFTIANNSYITGVTGASLTNAGTLIKTGGSGVSSIGVATINTGVVEVGSGGMSFLAGVSGTGSFKVDAGTSLKFSAAVAAGSAVTLGAGTELFVNATAGFAGSIAGFAAGDLIETTGIAYAGASLGFDSVHDILTVTNGSTSIGLQLAGSYTGSSFQLFSDNGVAAISHT